MACHPEGTEDRLEPTWPASAKGAHRMCISMRSAILSTPTETNDQEGTYAAATDWPGQLCFPLCFGETRVATEAGVLLHEAQVATSSGYEGIVPRVSDQGMRYRGFH